MKFGPHENFPLYGTLFSVEENTKLALQGKWTLNHLEGLGAIYNLNSFPLIAGCHTMATGDLPN